MFENGRFIEGKVYNKIGMEINLDWKAVYNSDKYFFYLIFIKILYFLFWEVEHILIMIFKSSTQKTNTFESSVV